MTKVNSGGTTSISSSNNAMTKNIDDGKSKITVKAHTILSKLESISDSLSNSSSRYDETVGSVMIDRVLTKSETNDINIPMSTLLMQTAVVQDHFDDAFNDEDSNGEETLIIEEVSYALNKFTRKLSHIMTTENDSSTGKISTTKDINVMASEEVVNLRRTMTEDIRGRRSKNTVEINAIDHPVAFKLCVFGERTCESSSDDEYSIEDENECAVLKQNPTIELLQKNKESVIQRYVQNLSFDESVLNQATILDIQLSKTPKSGNRKMLMQKTSNKIVADRIQAVSNSLNDASNLTKDSLICKEEANCSSNTSHIRRTMSDGIPSVVTTSNTFSSLVPLQSSQKCKVSSRLITDIETGRLKQREELSHYLPSVFKQPLFLDETDILIRDAVIIQNQAVKRRRMSCFFKFVAVLLVTFLFVFMFLISVHVLHVPFHTQLAEENGSTFPSSPPNITLTNSSELVKLTSSSDSRIRIGREKWYADFSLLRCILDCIDENATGSIYTTGNIGCGKNLDYSAGEYDTLEECCFMSFSSSHGKEKKCLEVSSPHTGAGMDDTLLSPLVSTEGTMKGNNLPVEIKTIDEGDKTSTVATVGTTTWLVTEVAQVQPILVLPELMKASTTTTTANVSTESVIINASLSMNPHATSQPSIATLVYIAFIDKCIQVNIHAMKNDLDETYETYQECCQNNFDDCFDGYTSNASTMVSSENEKFLTDTTKPIVKSTPTPEMSSTETNIISSSEVLSPERSKVVYFADLEINRCIQTEIDPSHASLQETYRTEHECCLDNFDWDKKSTCYHGNYNDTASSAPFSIPVIRSSSPSRFSKPTNITTTKPEIKISGKPSKTPVTVMPTVSPTLAPTSKPTMTATKLPSRLHTSIPTVRQNMPTVAKYNPSKKSFTNHPTPNPSIVSTAELTMYSLRAILLKHSPNSLAEISDETSVQYLAMNWLSSNRNIEDLNEDKKVQRWVLAILYYSLHGQEWTDRTGWLNINEDFPDECAWHNVICDASGYVIGLSLSNNYLWGTMPNEIALLHNCEYLSFSSNYLKIIPPAIFDMKNLKVLDLDDNDIDFFPPEINPSTQLEELYLSYNNISSLPDVLFDFEHLRALFISENKIISTIPSAFGKLRFLEELDLEANYFTGQLPVEFYNLKNLRKLWLFDNLLTGRLSSAFPVMTTLNVLDLSHNYIIGKIPTEIGQFISISEIYFKDNKLTGQIPSDLSKLINLTVLDISMNNLNSTIISEIGALQNMVTLRLDNNYQIDNDGNLVSSGLYGTIPETIGCLTRLKELRMDNNYIQGPLPKTLGDMESLEILRMELNDIRGSIPYQLGNALNLQYLHLWGNYIGGTMPSTLGNLVHLKELLLDDNKISGAIPSELGKLSNATFVSLASNQFNGVIPKEVVKLSNLKRLDLQSNNIHGQLPTELGELSLAILHLEGNNLYGDIPLELCQSDAFISGNCATTPATSQQNHLRIGQSGGNFTSNIPSSSSVPGYWWSCNCCTKCYIQPTTM